MSQFSSDDIKGKRPLFLVTALQDTGTPRGQTVKTFEDAVRLFNHFVSQDNITYCDIRPIGGAKKRWQRVETNVHPDVII